jgi:hypothetical protein
MQDKQKTCTLPCQGHFNGIQSIAREPHNLGGLKDGHKTKQTPILTYIFTHDY